MALGFPTLADYVTDFTQGHRTPWPLSGGSGDTYFGAIIGRYANRIANPSFTLNGHTYNARRQQRPEHAPRRYLGWNTQGLERRRRRGKSAAALKLRLAPGRRGLPEPHRPGLHGFPADV